MRTSFPSVESSVTSTTSPAPAARMGVPSGTATSSACESEGRSVPATGRGQRAGGWVSTGAGAGAGAGVATGGETVDATDDATDGEATDDDATDAVGEAELPIMCCTC